MADPKYIKEQGTFDVFVTKAVTGQSKKGDPMLTVTFAAIADGREINAYFVPKHKNMLDALNSLKFALDLPEAAKKEELLGKKVTITVGFQDNVDKNGKPYTQITEYTSYGKAVPPAKDQEEDDLPF